MGKYIIRKVATGVKFDLKAANGQTIATSEVYKSEAACRKGIRSVCVNAAAAGVEDQIVDVVCSRANPKFELYQDKAGQYRFRLKARNGAVIAVSEGYGTKASCLAGIESIRSNAPEAEIMKEE